jgi:hypothetical protein
MGVSGQRHVPAALPPERPGTQCIGWVPGPVWTRAENLAPTGIRLPDRPARGESQLTVTTRVYYWLNGFYGCHVYAGYQDYYSFCGYYIVYHGYQWSDDYYGYGNALKVFRSANMFLLLMMLPRCVTRSREPLKFCRGRIGISNNISICICVSNMPEEGMNFSLLCLLCVG